MTTTTGSSPALLRDRSGCVNISAVKFQRSHTLRLRYKTYAYENLKLSRPYASHPMKQAVIAPSMLSLLYPLEDKDAIPGYSREEFYNDLVNEVCRLALSLPFVFEAKRTRL
jgi:hypothetical protein